MTQLRFPLNIFKKIPKSASKNFYSFCSQPKQNYKTQPSLETNTSPL